MCDPQSVADYVALLERTRQRLVEAKGARLLVLGDLPALHSRSLSDYPDAPPGCRQDVDLLAKAAAGTPAASKEALASVLRASADALKRQAGA